MKTALVYELESGTFIVTLVSQLSDTAVSFTVRGKDQIKKELDVLYEQGYSIVWK